MWIGKEWSMMKTNIKTFKIKCFLPDYSKKCALKTWQTSFILLSYIYFIYGIHRWRIVRSSYRKMTWVGSKTTNNEFHWGALFEWAIVPRVQLGANYVQILQFHLLFSVHVSFRSLPSVATFALSEILHS